MFLIEITFYDLMSTIATDKLKTVNAVLRSSILLGLSSLREMLSFKMSEKTL